jgi:hypothetical protein
MGWLLWVRSKKLKIYSQFQLDWRREWDSNPRYGFPYTRFPSVRLKPLGHPSKAEKFRRQYSGRASGYNPGSRAVSAREIPARNSRSGPCQSGVRILPGTATEILAKAPRQQSPRRGTIPYAFRYRDRTTRRGEAGGRHGSWAIVMAPRHSAPNHHFDMGAWRPSRLILPSGSSVAKCV